MILSLLLFLGKYLFISVFWFFIFDIIYGTINKLMKGRKRLPRHFASRNNKRMNRFPTAQE